MIFVMFTIHVSSRVAESSQLSRASKRSSYSSAYRPRRESAMITYDSFAFARTSFHVDEHGNVGVVCGPERDPHPLLVANQWQNYWNADRNEKEKVDKAGYIGKGFSKVAVKVRFAQSVRQPFNPSS